MVCPVINSGMVNVEFSASMDFMEKPPGSELIYISGGRTVAECRNMAVDEARRANCTHLLQVDTDMIYPQDTIYRLLAHDVDVVCGFSVTRKPPHMPILGREGLTRYQWTSSWPTVSGDPDDEESLLGLTASTIVGGAALLVKMSVFDALEEPYFDTHIENGELVGEDIYFSQHCRDAGFDLWCDTELIVAHFCSGYIQPLYDNAQGRWLRAVRGVNAEVMLKERPSQDDGAHAAEEAAEPG
jgi:hypothetical protein